MSPKKFFAKLFKKFHRRRERVPDAVLLQGSPPSAPDPAAVEASASHVILMGNQAAGHHEVRA